MLKTVSSITNAIGALNYKGTWNASTNTPALASGVGTKGDYYVVSVAGSTNLDGETLWGVGDWAVFNGAVWQRLEGGSTINATTVTANSFIPNLSTIPTNGMYLPAANSIGFATNSTNAINIDSTQKVGLGIFPNAGWANSFAVVQALNQYSISSDGTNSNSFDLTSNAYRISAGSWKYLTGSSATNYRQANGQHIWSTAISGTTDGAISFTTGMTLNANSGLQTLNTIGVGNATPSTSGAGITFPASQSASSNANTLDDYVENIFSPLVIGTTSAGTGTYTTQVGRYTKIGNRVFYNIYLNWTAHTGTGNMRISGLPFVSNNATGNLSTPSVWPNNITLTAANILTALLGAGSSTIILYQYATGGGGVGTVPIDTAGELAITGHYEV